MQRTPGATSRHVVLLAVVAWYGVLAMLALAGAGSIQSWQIVATAFVFACGAALHARSAIRTIVNGVGGGVVGLVLVMALLIVRAFVTGDAGAEGETPYSLMIESPIWTAFLSPLAAGVGLVGAATRYWVELILRDRAAKTS
jgi:hypothetical protein